MLWLVWNVASLIPLANSIELFCRPDKFNLPIDSRKLYPYIVLVARDKTGDWKATPKAACACESYRKKLVYSCCKLYLAFSFKWPWIKAYSRTTFLTAFPSRGRLSCGTIAFTASIRLFVPLKNNKEKKTKLTNNIVFMIVLHSFLFSRTPFFRPRLNIIIFLPILGWKV